MNALEIRGLTKDYGAFCLRNLNLTLPSGCILGLIGENGAGKSTTIKLILDMIRKDEGTVTILGQDNQKNLPLLKQDIGVVLDEVGIPECLTPLQVGKIMAGTFTRWEDGLYRQYLGRFSLPEKKPFKELSKGMKMKLGLAVALSHHPKLLILDEATAGLDPVVREEILDILTDFTREESHSVLISSHIVSDLEKICDYIAILHQGELLLCEEKDRLLETYGLLSCTREQLEDLEPGAVLGKKISAYGVQALVRRDLVPAGWNISPVNTEELFIFLVKERG